MQPDYPLFFSFNFYFFSLLALASAIAFVTRKSPVSAALWLVQTMFCLAALYIMMGAHFIGAIQVLVYAGAIMVVFLFVVMLLNLGQPDELADARRGWWRLGAGVVGIALLSLLAATSGGEAIDRIASRSVPVEQATALTEAGGVIAPIARPLFGEHLLAFELTSVLLLAAIVGAVVLGRRREAGDVG